MKREEKRREDPSSPIAATQSGRETSPRREKNSNPFFESFSL
jgi:hypothetical protein